MNVGLLKFLSLYLSVYSPDTFSRHRLLFLLFFFLLLLVLLQILTWRCGYYPRLGLVLTMRSVNKRICVRYRCLPAVVLRGVVWKTSAMVEVFTSEVVVDVAADKTQQSLLRHHHHHYSHQVDLFTQNITRQFLVKCTASFLCCQHDTARICCQTPCCGAVAAGHRRPPLSIDISCPHGAQQQTHRTPMLMSIDGRRTDGQTDRRAIDRSIDPAPHTMRPVWILGVMESVLYKYCNVVIVLQFVCLRQRLRLTTCSVSRFGARRRRHISTATSRHVNVLETLGHQRLQRCSSHSPGPTAPSAPSAARLQLSAARYPAQCSIVSLCQRLNLSERRSHFLTHLHTTNCITNTRVEQNTAQKIGRCMTNDRSTWAYVRAN